VYSRDQVDHQLRTKSIDELRDLGDARASAAGSAARLAALRALPEDLGRMRKFAEEFQAYRSADSRFHIEVGVAAQSPRLTMTIVQLQGETAPLLWAPDAASADESAREHFLLVAAIEARDAYSAQTIAIEHCEREARVLIDRHLKLAAA
jgi:DNA-binding FadR family transcriptional regulator